MRVNKKIFSILFILIINVFITRVYSQDEKYYFKGNFGTSALAVSKSNNIEGTVDLLITRSQGSYRFQYNVTLNKFNGNDYFSSRIAGPSAPKKEDGQLKVALSYSNPTVSDTVFIGQGTQSLSISSPAFNLLPPILQGLTTNPEKSNYASEQFYIAFNIKSDTTPVTRAQLLYVGSTNLPIPGGGVDPDGSSSSSPDGSTTPPPPSATSSNLPSNSGSSSSPGLNPGGVETQSSNSNSTESSSDNHSSDSNSILPTLGIVSLFVFGLVIMS
ncbi:hypothetical protein DICPUDRAFT_85114 [Dictyostelium purpureum]|uniref:Uncharacterized protein n=1 Tax=Dictyostelium purpureum TaxID=5786 RepID=F1A4R5_DICPU|nr:uncharacterized protein DICPUDRAFT_85114 [Dictyostelium purpureum]EGC28817.1 hypothetical protein DICPUDRAFT_85114 [Dictyostelium purpureum]|eukprot:XP_003294659.1 hypothetical protein DICPUDRAFT_85114 [Dictyostelium purpureum]